VWWGEREGSGTQSRTGGAAEDTGTVSSTDATAATVGESGGCDSAFFNEFTLSIKHSFIHSFIHSFCSLSYDRSTTFSKASSEQSVI